MQKILAFNTIQRGISIILQENDRVIYTKNIETEKQSELLVSSIEDTLEENGLHYNDMDIFSTIIGPGNFTSIKTSIAVLKALRLATGKKVVVSDLFEIIENLNTETIILKQNNNKYYIKENNNYSMTTNIDNYNGIVSDGIFSKEVWAKLIYEKVLAKDFAEKIEPLYIEPAKVTCRKK